MADDDGTRKKFPSVWFDDLEIERVMTLKRKQSGYGATLTRYYNEARHIMKDIICTKNENAVADLAEKMDSAFENFLDANKILCLT